MVDVIYGKYKKPRNIPDPLNSGLVNIGFYFIYVTI